MRLRFVVVPERKGTNETFQVRMDLINVTDQPIKLLGDWPSDHFKGDYKEYLESDVSILTEPSLMNWVGQAQVSPRNNSQPEYTLGAKEVLTLQWVSLGRRLKNKSIHHFTTQNPRLPTDGLYSVRASVLLRPAAAEPEKKKEAAATKPATPATNDRLSLIDDASWKHFMKSSEDSNPHGSILLTSNEQLVPVGGSHALPKHALAKLLSADTNLLTAMIDLGAAHKVEVGDQFQILTGTIGQVWRLKITRVDRTYSEGVLEPRSRGTYPVDSGVLIRGALAELLTKDDPRR